MSYFVTWWWSWQLWWKLAGFIWFTRFQSSVTVCWKSKGQVESSGSSFSSIPKHCSSSTSSYNYNYGQKFLVTQKHLQITKASLKRIVLESIRYKEIHLAMHSCSTSLRSSSCSLYWFTSRKSLWQVFSMCHMTDMRRLRKAFYAIDYKCSAIRKLNESRS